MRLQRVATHVYVGTYLGRAVRIERLRRGDWLAVIDSEADHFASLERARREIVRVIAYANQF